MDYIYTGNPNSLKDLGYRTRKGTFTKGDIKILDKGHKIDIKKALDTTHEAIIDFVLENIDQPDDFWVYSSFSTDVTIHSHIVTGEGKVCSFHDLVIDRKPYNQRLMEFTIIEQTRALTADEVKEEDEILGMPIMSDPFRMTLDFVNEVKALAILGISKK